MANENKDEIKEDNVINLCHTSAGVEKLVQISEEAGELIEAALKSKLKNKDRKTKAEFPTLNS